MKQTTPAQVYACYKDGIGGRWIWRASNADVRAIAKHLGIQRGTMTKTELISVIVMTAPELK
jgi:hypothetical protein